MIACPFNQNHQIVPQKLFGILPDARIEKKLNKRLDYANIINYIGKR